MSGRSKALGVGALLLVAVAAIVALKAGDSASPSKPRAGPAAQRSPSQGPRPKPLTLRDVAATWEQARVAGAMAFVAKHRTEGILLASIRGVALANAKRRRHGRAPVSREEEHTDAMRDRRGA